MAKGYEVVSIDSVPSEPLSGAGCVSGLFCPSGMGCSSGAGCATVDVLCSCGSNEQCCVDLNYGCNCPGVNTIDCCTRIGNR